MSSLVSLVSSLMSLVWLIPYYLVGCLLSSMFKEPAPAGLAIAAAGIGVSVVGWFPQMRFLSPFHHAKAVDYFLYGQPPYGDLAIGIGVCLVSYIVASRVFCSRDW